MSAEIIKEIEGVTVACYSSWNNSMGFDECSATIYKDGEFKLVQVGIDTWYHFNTEAFINKTPESIRNLYKQKQIKEARHEAAKRLWQSYKSDWNLARRSNLQHRLQVVELRCIYKSREDFDKIASLLGTKKFRSSFRESVANQIRAWIFSPVANRKYSTPISPKQFNYLY